MAKDTEAVTEDGEKKGFLGGKLKLVAIILPVLLLAGGGLYFFVFAGGSGQGTSSSSSEACPEGETCPEDEVVAAAKHTEKPGEVVTVEAVTVNLAGGHYLKVGLALQATADAGEEVAPGKAADALIAEFSGKTMDELATGEGREAAKEALLKTIKAVYEKKVYEIFYTTFVMN
ncbi:MAG: flagellar protein FliL [Actinomycetota bacterium]|nr:flagellar protein FliL [Actinomycetota bacterium]